MMVTGIKIQQSTQKERFPCSLCGGEVGVNSISGTKYDRGIERKMLSITWIRNVIHGLENKQGFKKC